MAWVWHKNRLLHLLAATSYTPLKSGRLINHKSFVSYWFHVENKWTHLLTGDSCFFPGREPSAQFLFHQTHGLEVCLKWQHNSADDRQFNAKFHKMGQCWSKYGIVLDSCWFVGPMWRRWKWNSSLSPHCGNEMVAQPQTTARSCQHYAVIDWGSGDSVPIVLLNISR